jgi:hypothetical protein
MQFVCASQLTLAALGGTAIDIYESRLLKFCYVPTTSACFSKGIFVVATNSTNKTDKAVGMCHYSV